MISIYTYSIRFLLKCNRGCDERVVSLKKKNGSILIFFKTIIASYIPCHMNDYEKFMEVDIYLEFS